jgi:hypothetical protein
VGSIPRDKRSRARGFRRLGISGEISVQLRLYFGGPDVQIIKHDLRAFRKQDASGLDDGTRAIGLKDAQQGFHRFDPGGLDAGRCFQVGFGPGLVESAEEDRIPQPAGEGPDVDAGVVSGFLSTAALHQGLQRDALGVGKLGGLGGRG